MASLNPEASDFIQESHEVIQYTSMSTITTYPILPPLTWYPTPYYYYHPSCTIMEPPSYISLHYNNNNNNNNIIHVGQEWYMNSPLIITPSNSYFVPPSPHVEEITTKQHRFGHGGGATKKAIRGNSWSRRGGKKGLKPLKWGSSGNGCVEAGDSRTSVMIRNIPNKFTREMLVKALDDHCMEENQNLIISKLEQEEGDEEEQEEGDEEATSFPSEYDFAYLPIDFDTKCNKGYAFVNFTNPSGAFRLSLTWQNKKWDCFNSKKICEITYAEIQGKEALTKHFETTKFACEEDKYLPVCFIPPRDGSGGYVNYFTVGSCMKHSLVIKELNEE